MDGRWPRLMPRCSWCEREWTCGQRSRTGSEARPAWFGCLALTLAFDHFLYFAFLRTAGYVGCALGLGSGFLARCAFELLAFVFVGYFFSVHSTLIPAYFAMSFFNPYPGKLTVTFVSSPEPSRRSTVPLPYLAWVTVEPGPNFFFFTGAVCATGRAIAGAGLGVANPCGAGIPFSEKNCLMFST